MYWLKPCCQAPSQRPFFKDDNTRNKANGMVRDLTDKNLLMFLHFLLDILDVIETASLEFQKRWPFGRPSQKP